MLDKNLISAPFFTIIIPTLNEEKCLPILLNDLVKQTWTDFEVIHVDGCSDDATVKKSMSFLSKLRLKILTCEQRNVSVQRNMGGERAQGKWIIFMDADDQLPNYFLQGIKYRIERAEAIPKKKFGIFTTAIHLNDQDKRDALNKTTVNFLNMVMKAAESTDKPVAFGAMIGIKADIFRKFKFKINSKVLEDSLLVEEVKRAGHHFVCLRDPTYAYSMRRMRSNGLGRTAMSGLRMNFMRLLGDDFSKKNYGYEMLGGENYDIGDLEVLDEIYTEENAL